MKYEFVRVAVAHGSKSKPTDLVEQRIHELASKGWRLVQILVEIPASVPVEYVIVVERNSEA
jgi:hypothetical protein